MSAAATWRYGATKIQVYALIAEQIGISLMKVLHVSNTASMQTNVGRSSNPEQEEKIEPRAKS